MLALVELSSVRGIVSAQQRPICDEHVNRIGADLGGGPTAMMSSDPAECRSLCERTELCSAFVHIARGAHSECLPINKNDPPRSFTNMPPLWPAAQCYLKGPDIASIPNATDKCTCFGLPRASCEPDARPAPCADVCEPSGLAASFNVQCGARRGFTLPDANGTLANVSAARCSAACEAHADCVAWSWSSCAPGLMPQRGMCELKNLVGRVEASTSNASETFSCTATRAWKPVLSAAPSASLPSNFTPWTYLVNPYHRSRHRSGNLRTHDRLNGLALYPDANAPHDPAAAAHSATLAVAPMLADGTPLFTADALAHHGVERHAAVHTKNRLTLTHVLDAVRMVTTWWQVDENVLAARVELNALAASAMSEVRANFAISLALDAGDQHGLPSFEAFTPTPVHIDQPHGAALQAKSGVLSGDWTVHAFQGASGDVTLRSFNAFDTDDALAAGIAAGTNLSGTLSTQRSTFYLAQSFSAALPMGSTATLLVLAARSAPERRAAGGDEAMRNIAAAVAGASASAPFGEAQNTLNRLMAEDATFWEGAVTLEGEGWPAAWRRGLVYDLESVRANVRPATGVFLHPWDSMQVHNPRIVVAESSMDMLTLSFADMPLAKRVLSGLYHDTAVRAQPQIPCQLEDGTPNMECADNHTAGTPPSWGQPLWVVADMFARDGDVAWLGSMYPVLAGYLDFWLANRTDAGGYQIAMCSWESGQDNMKRWGWDQMYGGDNSTRIIRAPEHQAAMAHAAAVMAAFGRLLGKPAAEVARWEVVRDSHVALTQSLYNDDANWFCDFNSLHGVWQSGCRDNEPAGGTAGAGKQSVQLTPLMLDAPQLGAPLLATVRNVSAILDVLRDSDKLGTDPPGSLTFDSYCRAPAPLPPLAAVSTREGHELADVAVAAAASQTPPPNVGGSPGCIDPAACADPDRCVQLIWAPHPFLMIAAAGNANATSLASATTSRLADRVWAAMDARTRTSYGNDEGSPYPGVAYECWTKQTCLHPPCPPADAPMARSCGGEQYAWSAQATVVSVLREVVGFRALLLDAGGFALRPALPKRLLADAIRTRANFTVRGLGFRGHRFDVTIWPAASRADEGMLEVEIREVRQSAVLRTARVDGVQNARDELRVELRKGGTWFEVLHI